MQSESNSRNGSNWGAAVEADAIGSSSRSGHNQGADELNRTQLGSSSRSGHNRGAVEVDAIREQQLKRMQEVSSS